MKHRHSNRILGRIAPHRQHLLRNLSSALLEHGAITVALAKAKALRTFFEPLVTEAKKELTVHRRRLLLRRLGRAGDLPRLLTVADSHKTRQGGYTRLTRLQARTGDGSSRARIEIIK